MQMLTMLPQCRTEQFAAEARVADQAVMRLRQETGELKASLATSKAECDHLRQQMRVSSRAHPVDVPCCSACEGVSEQHFLG